MQQINKLEISNLTQNILELAKTQQSFLIQLNKKLKFYSLFKQDNKKSHYLDLIKYTNHQCTVATIRTSNHKLMIEYGRYCTPKIPEHLRLCQYCSINEIKDEQHLTLNCITSTKDNISLIVWVNPSFHSLSANNMMLFLFNNVDPFVSKKLGHFIFQAFEKRERLSLNITTI